MIRRGLWFFITTSFAELIALIYLVRSSGLIGIAVTVLFSATGAYFLSILAPSTLRRTALFAQGKPHDQYLEIDQIKLFSSFLLFMPGPISTIMGLLLLVPPIGRYARSRVLETPIGQSLVKISNFNERRRQGSYQETVEVDLVRHDPPEGQRPRTHISNKSGD